MRPRRSPTEARNTALVLIVLWGSTIEITATGVGMRSCLIYSLKPFPWLRMGFIGGLTLVLCGWTCTAIVGFQSCLGLPPAPQIASLSPTAISATADSILLTVS